MIEVRCKCPAPSKLAESTVGKRFRCPNCGELFHIVAGETIADGAGSGDFNSSLTVIAGPILAGTTFLIGGTAEIQIGKLADRNINLPGENVSRQHCKLVRVESRPSRWKIVDNNSTNGVYVNQVRVREQELKSGDEIDLGDYELKYSIIVPLKSATNMRPITTPSMGSPIMIIAAAMLGAPQEVPPAGGGSFGALRRTDATESAGA